MKRRNLFLSIICSILMAVALVTFTVISVVPNKNAGNNKNNAGQVSDNDGPKDDENLTINDDRDGSAEKPYIIYSAESFMTYVVGKYKGENGNYIDYTATNENGELLYPELNKGLNYELKNDIDFAGSNFVTIFNEGIAFNGYIDGKGFALKNISIELSKENLDLYAKLGNDNRFSAYVGVFGKLDGAQIVNIKIADIKIAVADEVYAYVTSGEYATDKGAAMKEITIGTLAGVAYNTKLDEVVVSGTVDAGAYSVYASDFVQGFNAVGGVFGVADTCELTNISVENKLVVDNGKKFFVGGVAGYAYETKLANATVKSNILANYEQGLYIGGVYGYALAVNIDETQVALDVNETTIERFNTNGVKTVDDLKFIWVAGFVNRLVAETSADITTISNSKVVANVDIDGMYAGAVMDVYANASTTILNVKDVILDSNVVVLKAYGFARTLVNANIDMAKTEIDEVNELEFNIRLTGEVKLVKSDSGKDKLIVAKMFSNIGKDSKVSFVGGIASVKAVCSKAIYSNLELADYTLPFGGTGVKVI